MKISLPKVFDMMAMKLPSIQLKPFNGLRVGKMRGRRGVSVFMFTCSYGTIESCRVNILTWDRIER